MLCYNIHKVYIKLGSEAFMDQFYRQNLIAVFLGDDRSARKRARSLNLRYGINSVMLDKKPSIISYLSPCVRVRSIGDGQ